MSVRGARGRADKVVVLERPYPPLDRQPCQRCGAVGVAVVVMWEREGVPAEALYCKTECAAFDGWPWLTVEQPKRKAAAEVVP